MRHATICLTAALLGALFAAPVHAVGRRFECQLAAVVEQAFEQSPLGQLSRALDNVNQRLDAAKPTPFETGVSRPGQKPLAPRQFTPTQREVRFPRFRKLLRRRLICEMEKLSAPAPKGK